MRHNVNCSSSANITATGVNLGGLFGGARGTPYTLSGNQSSGTLSVDGSTSSLEWGN